MLQQCKTLQNYAPARVASVFTHMVTAMPLQGQKKNPHNSSSSLLSSGERERLEQKAMQPEEPAGRAGTAQQQQRPSRKPLNGRCSANGTNSGSTSPDMVTDCTTTSSSSNCGSESGAHSISAAADASSPAHKMRRLNSKWPQRQRQPVDKPKLWRPPSAPCTPVAR